ncbi:unnamed protein product [Malus baccata var. baccata]|uniref:Uncharacterized protein n=1 Tax=Malus baccata TaxID=106549 RepID=A0A540MDX9_MALBA|nr:hypothetical protein C1H46_017428 [Malus baccata]
MYGTNAIQLVKEIANGEKGQLTAFSSNLFKDVIAECSQHYEDLQKSLRKMQEAGIDFQTQNEDHYGFLIHHLSLLRNKRCLMTYMHSRAEMLRNLIWKVGYEIPEEIEEKLSHTEKEYFKKHSEALRSYMSRVELHLDMDMVPPKDPYIKVRVLDDMGEVQLPSFNTANFAQHSMHFLKRTDAEKYISLGKMEELTG